MRRGRRLNSRSKLSRNTRSQSILKSGHMNWRNYTRKPGWQRSALRNAMIWFSGSVKVSMCTKQWSWRCSISPWHHHNRRNMTEGMRSCLQRRKKCLILQLMRKQKQMMKTMLRSFSQSRFQRKKQKQKKQTGISRWKKQQRAWLTRSMMRNRCLMTRHRRQGRRLVIQCRLMKRWDNCSITMKRMLQRKVIHLIRR